MATLSTCNASGAGEGERPKDEKKIRKANFSATEISVLTERVQESLEILQSKFTNSVTNQEKDGERDT
jgi:hypothetical protein